MCSITKNNEKTVAKATVFRFLHLFLMFRATAAATMSASGALRMTFAQRNIAALDH